MLYVGVEADCDSYKPVRSIDVQSMEQNSFCNSCIICESVQKECVLND